jgi:hypothetical protein
LLRACEAVALPSGNYDTDAAPCLCQQHPSRASQRQHFQARWPKIRAAIDATTWPTRAIYFPLFGVLPSPDHEQLNIETAA